MRIVQASVVCVSMALLSAGCAYHAHHHYDETVVAVQPQEDVDEAPVFDGPGVEVIDVEPAPADRVYVYDPGYPPGTYFYNDHYYYHGYRYDHDAFVNRYVHENVRNNRYVNVEENRRAGRPIEQQHRTAYNVNHGKRPQRSLVPVNKQGRPPEVKNHHHNPNDPNDRD